MAGTMGWPNSLPALLVLAFSLASHGDELRSSASGAAFNLSRFRDTECPAGKYGRVVVRGNSFEFDRRPGVGRRFYGVLLHGDANLPSTDEDAKGLAACLVGRGCNALRFDGRVETGDGKGMDAPAPSLETLRRFDGLVAACIENGIYVMLDLPVRFSAQEGSQSNLFSAARVWLDHVNGGTGRRLADEPALAWVSLTDGTVRGEDAAALAAQGRKFLREEMKCGALLASPNGDWIAPTADFDFVDDSPRAGGGAPGTPLNANPFANARLGVPIRAERRVLDRPFACIEKRTGSGLYHDMDVVSTVSIAALQGWNAVWRSCPSEDPRTLAAERVSVLFYLRRDLPELARTYAVHLPQGPDLGSGTNVTATSFTWAGWYAKLGRHFGEAVPEGMIDAGTFPAVCGKTKGEVFSDLGLVTPEDGEFPRGGDGTVRVDRDAGAFTVLTPRTCGGFAEEGAIRAQVLMAHVEGGAASVWASSLDGWPLEVSSRVLVTHLSGARDGRARCRLRLADGRWTVYALAADGARRREVPSVFARGRLDFTAQADADPRQATCAYELVREE